MTRLTENVAAISAVFHQDKRYQKFYDDHGESVQGFPGIWRYVANMAEEFTRAEFPKCWDAHDWIESVDAFVDALYRADEILTFRDARLKAAQIIRCH